ncbi:MAG TPA: hemerythrin domain-containing protein [Streptosporangiaceae bacterium]|nr:hemerythrin domain-containing protein [Streptosporangiaceae bacterium]
MTRESIPRRSVLLTAGGLVAGGAGGAGAALALSGSAKPAARAAGLPPWLKDEAQPAPNEDLMSEHGLLIRILLIYRHLLTEHAAGKPILASQPRDAALVIHDYIEAFHEELEEAYVFPRLVAAGLQKETVSTLLLQHARGREQTQLILASTASAGTLPPARAERVAGAMAAFVRMYEPHEAREDTVIYPAFRSLLTPAQVAELGERFAQLQREQFGPAALAS